VLTASDSFVSAYQTRRERDGVSNRTVNLELGVLRSILRRYRMWEPIAADVDFLRERVARTGTHSRGRNRPSGRSLKEPLPEPLSRHHARTQYRNARE